MEIAKIDNLYEILELYKSVIDSVNKTNIKLGWNIDIYPNYDFVKSAIENEEMLVVKDNGLIVAVAVVNHNMNMEYNDIDWKFKSPMNEISTIHALATLPTYRNKTISDSVLSNIESYCIARGDKAIHLDVIDTNIPAYKLYTRNGYEMIEQIKMYYEVVGTREFWMFEKLL